MEGQLHPYVPRNLQLPGYVPPSFQPFTILAALVIPSILLVSLVWILSGILSRKITKIDRLLMCWWALSGLIHIIVEGYYALSPYFYTKNGSFLADLWKEYSKGDSRFAARDTGLVVVEALTAAFVGPACLFSVYAIATGKSYSHILQFTICHWYIFAAILSVMTSFLEGDNIAASSFYYYAYYIAGTYIWTAIASLIAIRCWRKMCAAATQVQRQGKVKSP